MYSVEGLLNAMGPGRMGTTAYDTAWVSRLFEIDADMANHALKWVNEHQLSDGSWGAEFPVYYHDRIVSTLAAMIVLSRRGRRAFDRVQVDKGLQALEQLTSNATHHLSTDINGATIGFELIAPTLVAEAEKLGIIRQQGDRILGKISKLRKIKLEKLSGYKISRYLSTALSAEMAGTDSLDLLDPWNLQESNGSVGNSPAATAHFVLNVHLGDENALAYLRSVLVDGGAPFVAPFEVFERLWILWNLNIANLLTETNSSLSKPHLDYLAKHWKPSKGIGFSAAYSTEDGDDTGLAYDLLTGFGYNLDMEAVLTFEEKDHFRCFQLEANPSLDSNIHILGALRRAGCDAAHPLVHKAIGFIRQHQTPKGFWFDKWNVSPYYTTSHAVIFCQGFDDEMCKKAVDWIVSTQRSNGGWGYYGVATAEETAYCLQALGIWRRRTGRVPSIRVEHGRRWLIQNSEPPYPPLWIGKSLYCPELLVQSVVLSALALSQEN